ncbi:PARPT-like protein [Mya arenaria]|uniref:Poly [ADP-ribose] polymerase n=1 Tax=Mya arenaria TaxID=6604 RepID=A0ABY7FVU5_MYAAR|nr:PARPT-like protein [Mya arenaria]
MSMGDDKYTCLHIAAVNDFVEIAGLMLEMGGAKPDPKDKEMRTPLHLAVVRQHKRTIELLLNKKADVNAQDKDGNTPLHLSQNVKLLQSFRKTVSNVKNDINIQIVYTLLEKGADLYIKNNDNFTPVDLIIDPTMKKMIEKLQDTYKKDPVMSQAGVKLPIHWTSMKVTEVVCIKLDLNDTMQRQEYQEVDKHFHDSMPNATIASRKYGQGGANELHLYHGTRPDIVENIVHDNFDFRIAGSRVGALYGDGSYFATTAKYSDLYASQDSDTGFKTMFVAKVLGGKNCLGAPGMKRPPQIDPKDFKKGYYDSVVNNILSPTIYCVFDMNQYYPEYYIDASGNGQHLVPSLSIGPGSPLQHISVLGSYETSPQQPTTLGKNHVHTFAAESLHGVVALVPAAMSVFPSHKRLNLYSDC